MLKRFCVLLVLCVGVTSFSTASAAEPTPADQLTAALDAWRAGDLGGARDGLSALIAQGTSDARLYFYRGVLDERLGASGDADFQTGADLEAARSSTRLVNRALENTQGTLRSRIEKLRVAARDKYKADPTAASAKLAYRDALALRANGDLPAALAKLNTLAVDGADPRYFYMKGVVLAESGDVESARVAFQDGLRHERTPEDAARVSLALTDVQGEVRRLIEAETTVQVGEVLISRQDNLDQIRRMSSSGGDSALAEFDAARAAAEQKAATDREARRIAAAAQFEAAEKAALDQMAKVADVAAAEPAGSIAGARNSQDAVLADMPPETPVVADSTASSNPFLGGAAALPTRPADSVPAVPSVSPGPIDMSYLPATTELLVYVRPADVLASGFVKPLASLPQFQMAMDAMSAEAGFNATEIESVTIGMANLMATMVPIITQASTGGAPPDPNAMAQKLFGGENALMVIRTVKDLSPESLMQQSKATQMTFEGKNYYVLPTTQPGAPTMVIYPIDGRTFISASEAAAKVAITNGAGEATREAFGFVSRSSHVVQAFSSPLLAGMSGSIPPAPETSPPPVGEFLDAIRGKVSGVASIFNAGSDLNFTIALQLSEPEAVGAAAPALDQLAQMGQQMFPMVSAQVPPPLQQSVQQIVTSLKVSDSESVVTVSLTIPGTLVTTLLENPQLLGPLMGGGMAPGNGPPGFGPPGGESPGFGPPGNNAPPAGNANPGFGTPGTGQAGQPGEQPGNNSGIGAGASTPVD